MTDLLPRVAVLSDGTRVEVRSLRAEDRDELARAFARLSPASRYARFLGSKRELDDEELRFLTEVDGRDHVAIVAVRDSDDLKSEIGLGVARFIRLPPGDVAEAALTVADAAQNKGLGRVLLEVLAVLAKEQGIRAFRAEVLADNARMRRLLEGSGGVVIAQDPVSLTYRTLPSGSRKSNIGGTPSQRSSSSTSTPAAVSRAWSPAASPVANRIPVSTPPDVPGRAGTSATVGDPPGGATSIQRPPNSSSGASITFSNPSTST